MKEETKTNKAGERTQSVFGRAVTVDLANLRNKLEETRTQHVAGPWHLQHLHDQFHDYADWNVYVIRSNENVALAEVGHIDRHQSHRIEANARLMAAAPELLEACKGMLEWARRVKVLVPGPEVAAACAAICKAEQGRTNP